MQKIKDYLKFRRVTLYALKDGMDYGIVHLSRVLCERTKPSKHFMRILKSFIQKNHKREKEQYEEIMAEIKAVSDKLDNERKK